MTKKKNTLPQTVYVKVVHDGGVTYLNASESVDEITEVDPSIVGVYELKATIRSHLVVKTEIVARHNEE